MAQFLLSTTLLTILGLLVGTVQGFGVDTRLAAANHIVLSLITVVAGLFSQSMTMFFFIGTGKEIKEKARGTADEAAVINETKEYKSRVFPVAMQAMGILMLTFILGGGLHRAMLDHQVGSTSWLVYLWLHRVLVLATLLMYGRAYWIEMQTMVRNARLMERFLRETTTENVD